MKMEGVGDVMIGRNNEVAKTQPSPKGFISNLIDFVNIDGLCVYCWDMMLWLFIATG